MNAPVGLELSSQPYRREIGDSGRFSRVPKVTQLQSSRTKTGKKGRENDQTLPTAQLHTKQHISEGLEGKSNRDQYSHSELLKNRGEGSAAHVNSEAGTIPGLQ